MAAHNAVADFRFWSHFLIWLVQPLNEVAEEHLRAHASDQSIWFSPPGSRPSLVVGPFDVEKLVAELRSASFDVAGLWIYRN